MKPVPYIYNRPLAALCKPLLNNAFAPFIEVSEEEIKILETHWNNGYNFQTTGDIYGTSRGAIKIKYDKVIAKIVAGLYALPKHIRDLQEIKNEVVNLRKQNREFHRIFNALPTTEKNKIGNVDVRAIRFDEMPDISRRLHNVMKYLELQTVGDLIRMCEGRKDNLFRIRNFGRKCMTEIEEMEKEYGFNLENK